MSAEQQQATDRQRVLGAQQHATLAEVEHRPVALVTATAEGDGLKIHHARSVAAVALHAAFSAASAAG